MQTLFTHKIKIIIALLLVGVISVSQSAIVSRLTTFTDGSILTAADLNSEFNNIINTVNNLDNDNLSSTANISPSKISAAIAGGGIARDGGTGELSVNVDTTSVEVSGDTVQIKANGVSNAKIRQSAGVSVIGRSANTTGDVADITSTTDGHVLRQSGTSIGFGTIVAGGLDTGAVTSAKILDGTIATADIGASQVTTTEILDGTIATADIGSSQVTQAKRAALGQSVSSSSGAFNTPSSGDTDVTNLSVTITTTGRPVYIGLIPDGTANHCEVTGTSGTTVSVVFKIKRGSTSLGSTRLISSSGVPTAASPCGAIWNIDTGASAGSTTYKLTVLVQSGTGVNVNYAKLIAYEL